MEAGLKVAGLNWFVCMNCCWLTAVEAGGAWLMTNWDVGPLLGVTCLLGWMEVMEVMEVMVSGPGDTNWTLGLNGWAAAL